MNPDELLKSVMENRRGKGLPIALTDAQIMQVWAIDIFPVPVLAGPTKLLKGRTHGEDNRQARETRRNVNPTGRAPFGWHLCK